MPAWLYVRLCVHMMQIKDVGVLLAIERIRCSAKPCENGASCTDISEGEVACKCVKGYAGHFCERTYNKSHVVSINCKHHTTSCKSDMKVDARYICFVQLLNR